MFYLDTSVLVAYYCPESLSESVQKFLSEQVKPGISSLTEVELFSAVAKKVRTKEVDQADGNRILAKFSSHVDGELFTMISVENHHWRMARGWLGLFTTPLRALDAIHLAIASAEGLELITCDRFLHQAAGALNVKSHFMDG